MLFLQQWLLRVVVCAAMVGFSREVVRDGATAEVVRFCGGLVLLLCLLQPLGDLELAELSANGGSFRYEIEHCQEKYRSEQKDLMAKSIAERTEEYIEDKAAEFGSEILVAVKTQEKEGVILPDSVAVSGPYNAELSIWMAEELGIPVHRQEWREVS